MPTERFATRIASRTARSPPDGPVTTFAQTPRLPAHATALGKALLAFSSTDLVERVIANGLERYTPNTLTDPDRLHHCLATVRLTRVAVSRWELDPGCIAPIDEPHAPNTIRREGTDRAKVSPLTTAS